MNSAQVEIRTVELQLIRAGVRVEEALSVAPVRFVVPLAVWLSQLVAVDKLSFH
jgi:hypothetical protein